MQRGGTSAREAVVDRRGCRQMKVTGLRSFARTQKGFAGEMKNSQADCKFIVISSPLFPNTNIIVYVFTELPHIMASQPLYLYMPTHRGYPLKQVSQGVADSSKQEGDDLQICMGSRINKTLPVGVCMAVQQQKRKGKEDQSRWLHNKSRLGIGV